MIALIAFSKTMTGSWKGNSPLTTEPRWHGNAMRYARTAAGYSVRDFETLLGVNQNIAEVTLQRYLMMLHDEAEQLPAMAAYTGAVFRRIDVASWTAEDWNFAQDHVRIMSAIYGMLRPLDRISAYRMEGKVYLGDHTEKGEKLDLFHAWRPLLTPVVIQEVLDKGGELVDLASGEMRLFFNWTEIERHLKIVKPDFYQYSGGKLKAVTMYAKMCRGEMLRYMVRNRLTDPEELKDFQWEGFRFNEEKSDPLHYIFVREQ